ncbi:MAG: hypothetical protein M3063_01850 [Actinomycetota bacterium]|nr:hypothetical protein [Actinomycetota bacterium]
MNEGIVEPAGSVEVPPGAGRSPARRSGARKVGVLVTSRLDVEVGGHNALGGPNIAHGP